MECSWMWEFLFQQNLTKKLKLSRRKPKLPEINFLSCAAKSTVMTSPRQPMTFKCVERLKIRKVSLWKVRFYFSEIGACSRKNDATYAKRRSSYSTQKRER